MVLSKAWAQGLLCPVRSGLSSEAEWAVLGSEEVRREMDPTEHPPQSLFAQGKPRPLVTRALWCPQGPLPSPLWALRLEALVSGTDSGWGPRHCPAPPVGSVSEVSRGWTPRAPSGRTGPGRAHRPVRTGPQGAVTSPVRAGSPPRKPLPPHLPCSPASLLSSGPSTGLFRLDRRCSLCIP